MESRFQLTITGTEHGEWQGILRTADGRETAFLSVLDLIRAIAGELEKE